MAEEEKTKPERMCLADRPLVEASAAGVDSGAREMYVAVPPDRDENPVRVFATFTEDLNRLGLRPPEKVIVNNSV